MNRLELQELIDRKTRALEAPYVKDEAYSVFFEFVSKNSFSKMSDFLNIDIYGLFKCLAYLKGKNLSIEKCSAISKGFFVLDDLNEEGLDYFLDFAEDIYVGGKIPTFVQFLRENNRIKERYLIKKMFPKEEQANEILMDFKKEYAEQLDDVITLFNFMEDDIDSFTYLMEFYKAYKGALDDKARLNSQIEDEALKVRPKKYNRALEKTLRCNYDVSEIVNRMKLVYDFVSDSDRKEEAHLKNNQKEIRGYDRALHLLDEALGEGEVVSARSIIKQIKDEEVKLAILQLIYEHNMLYYEQLESEYKEISSDAKVKYQSLLHEYGIETENCKIEEVMRNKIPEIEIMLSYLKNKGFANEFILDVLRNTDFNTFGEVRSYIDKGYFPVMFVANNREIFYSESSILEPFHKNKAILDKYGINPYSFRMNLDLLFTENSKLEENLAILSSYGLLKSFKATIDLSFLSNQNFILKIDKLLELGYEKILEQDLNLLNYENLKRLEVLKVLGFVLDSPDEVEATLKSDKFILPDDELDRYIPNAASYSDLNQISVDSFQSLDSFRESVRTYKIGDSLISINKVSRSLNAGNGLLQAVTANSNLSTVELDKIVEALGGDTKKGQML